jgi:ATP-dependent Clp endopeptidase proteolytic subunit ClpP
MKNLKRNPKRSLLLENVKTNVDSKLTQAAIILEYSFIYGVNFKERTIRLTGEINNEHFQLVDSALTELEAQGRKSVTVIINSPGGDMYEALAIIGRLKRSPCHIVTEGYGQIMSASTLILASGDKRRVSEYAFFMHHEASYGVDGRHSEIKNQVKQADREDDKWCEWMSKFTKKDKKFWKSNGVGVDAYFSVEELLEHGVIDEII